MEYAVIESGSIQYRVQVGDVITIENVALDDSKEVLFDKVILYYRDGEVQIGKPYLNIVVKGVCECSYKSAKKMGIRFEHKVYRRPLSHRQQQMKIKITEITERKG